MKKIFIFLSTLILFFLSSNIKANNIIIDGIITTGSIFGDKFEPTDIEDCKLWLDANDIYTLNFNGNNITQWNDKSGYGYNAIQTVEDNQPTYIYSALNNKNVIRFVDDYLRMGDTNLFNKEHTIFLVGKHGTSENQWYFSKFKGTFDGEFFLAANYNIDWDFTYAIVNESDNRVDKDVDGIYDNDYHIIGVMYDGNNMYIFKNGNQIGSPSVQSGYIKSTSNELFIGLLSIGTDYDLQGDIAEIIVYNRNLNNIEFQQISRYLNKKWGL